MRTLLLLLILPTALIAQVYRDYHYLTCQGPIPAEFTTSYTVKYNKDLQNEKSRTKKTFVDKTTTAFLQKSNYLIDELLVSGKILFGDSVTAYVNEVAAEILKHEPQLKEKLRFYVLKSSMANAFSTNQGIIFVTLGLISQLENEAQLAYVLSHEVSHFEKRHTLNSYIENEKIYSTRGENRYSSSDNKLKAISNYSKQLELEADSLGILRFARTGYRPSEIMTSYDVLQFSYLPFGDFEFTPDFLTGNGLIVFPKSFLLDSVKPIDFSTEEKDDSRGTHPNIRKRREFAKGVIKGTSFSGTKTFLQNKDLFLRIRTIARYETLLIDLNDRQYVEVIYNALFLMKENPNSEFLQFMLAKALYGAAKYKTFRRFSKVGADYEDIEGNSQKCYYLFKQMNDEVLTSVAFRYIYELHVKTKNEFLGQLATDLLKVVQSYHSYTIPKLKEMLVREDPKPLIDTTRQVSSSDTVQTMNTDSSEVNSKYSKLRAQKTEWMEKKIADTREREAPKEDKFHYMSFDGLLENQTFLAMWKQADADYKSEKEMEDLRSSGKVKDDKHRLQAGIDTMVVIDPFYFSADSRNGLKLTDSEKLQGLFVSNIKKCAAGAGIHLSMLDPKSLGENEVSLFNDLGLVNDWMDERSDHDELDIIPLHRT